MSYTVAAAAAATGPNKTTIVRAIKFGNITGTKDEHGQWHVDAAELHRGYLPRRPPPRPGRLARSSSGASLPAPGAKVSLWRWLRTTG
jgi:hypothetical protein